MTFDKTFEILIGHEGGYQNDPADNNNFYNGINMGTKYGITPNAYYKFFKKTPTKEIMENLSLREAKEFYYSNYWKDSKTEELPLELRLIHFDTAVNHGVNKAIKILQSTIGVKPDGIFGPKTKAAIIAGYYDVYKYASYRIIDYIYIILRNPSKLKYVKGWIRKTLNNLKYIK